MSLAYPKVVEDTGLRVCVSVGFTLRVNTAGTGDMTGSAAWSVEVTALGVMSERLTRIAEQGDT